MKIRVYSKKDFINLMESNNLTSSNIEEVKSTIIISINDTSGVSYFKENLENVLVLYFDDLTYLEAEDLTLFNKEHALKIIKFFEKFKDKENLIVHCSAGISRSGALALYFNDYLRQDYFQFKKDNPKIIPNGFIYSLLRETYNEYKYKD